jgi:enterochelin esterase-like enzyme
MENTPSLRTPSRRAPRAAVAVGAVVLVAIGILGAYRYVQNYWLYRGFPPPHDPTFVTQTGTALTLSVKSSALGGRSQEVDVYLPPGYATHPAARYPVFYLLHGFPGRPGGFLETVRMGVEEDILYAQHQMPRPPILVMPFGSTGTFTDKEWANGIRPGEGWESFVAHDVVKAMDRRYRTIPTGSGRILGGLSEGGYGALNIGLHHPREFQVLESWSGYEKADDIPEIFGGRPQLLRWNSPMEQVGPATQVLRRRHEYIWFYSGSADPARGQNRRFSDELTQAGIPHKFFLLRGGHTWAAWRREAAQALLVATAHLRG